MKGFTTWIVIVIVFLIMLFIIVSLASGGTVGDGFIEFLGTGKRAIVAIWNASVY